LYRDLTVTTADSHRVGVRDHGSGGPPVLLLHGAGLNLAMWDGLARRIGDRYHLVAMDFLDHGKSRAVGPWTVDSDVRAIDSVIEELGLDRPVLIGHSYGGLLAVLYASTHPDCPQVINLDGLAGGRARPDHYLGRSPDSVATFWGRYMDGLRTMVPAEDAGDDAWLQREFTNARTADQKVDPDLLESVLERTFQSEGEGMWERRPPGRTLLSIIEQLGHVDMFDAYRSARCPVTLVLAQPQSGLGEEAEQFLQGYFQAFARSFPAVGEYLPERRMLTVNSGHGFPLEDPDTLADLVSRLVPA
jgi:pimeloyl-ACP methyl ester carboxylesterase